MVYYLGDTSTPVSWLSALDLEAALGSPIYADLYDHILAMLDVYCEHLVIVLINESIVRHPS